MIRNLSYCIRKSANLCSNCAIVRISTTVEWLISLVSSLQWGCPSSYQVAVPVLKAIAEIESVAPPTSSLTKTSNSLSLPSSNTVLTLLVWNLFSATLKVLSLSSTHHSWLENGRSIGTSSPVECRKDHDVNDQLLYSLKVRSIATAHRLDRVSLNRAIYSRPTS